MVILGNSLGLSGHVRSTYPPIHIHITLWKETVPHARRIDHTESVIYWGVSSTEKPSPASAPYSPPRPQTPCPRCAAPRAPASARLSPSSPFLSSLPSWVFRHRCLGLLGPCRRRNRRSYLSSSLSRLGAGFA